MHTLEKILSVSSSRHKHLCPRQVLGARMALYASEILGMELPRSDKRLLITAETDGCTVDGLIAATNCRLGSRTLRILDLGKVAATFTDTRTERSIRIAPSAGARTFAMEYFPQARNRWEAMLQGYQVMPLNMLFKVQIVQLEMPIFQIISNAGRRAVCQVCDEEIINGREVTENDQILCRTCAGNGYYQISLESGSLEQRADIT